MVALLSLAVLLHGRGLGFKSFLLPRLVTPLLALVWVGLYGAWTCVFIGYDASTMVTTLLLPFAAGFVTARCDSLTGGFECGSWCDVHVANVDAHQH